MRIDTMNNLLKQALFQPLIQSIEAKEAEFLAFFYTKKEPKQMDVTESDSRQGFIL